MNKCGVIINVRSTLEIRHKFNMDNNKREVNTYVNYETEVK